MQLNGTSDLVSKEFFKQSIFKNKQNKNKKLKKTEAFADLSQTDLSFALEQDVSFLKNVLNAYGYFDHKVDYHIRGKKLVIDVTAGIAFKVRGIKFFGCADQDICEQWFPYLKLKVGQPFRYWQLLETQEQLLNFLQNNGYPAPSYEKPHVLVDYKKKEVEVEIRIHPGLVMHFGELFVSGLEKVRLNYIKYKIPWKKGEIFNKNLLEKFRAELYESGLFSSVSFKKCQHEETGTVDIEARLRESLPRYIGLAGQFRTGEGPGGQIEWRHLNLTGRGDELQLAARAFKYFQRLETDYVLPHFILKNQKTHLSGSWEKSNRNAYKSNLTTLYPYVATKLNKRFTLYTGIQYQFGTAKKMEAAFDKQTKKLIMDAKSFEVSLVSLPVSLEFDGTDNKFAPTHGLYVYGEVSPFFGREKQNFTKFKVATSYLLPFAKKDEIPPMAWFNKMSLGQLIGKNLAQIVPHQRFYLGGPDTMRAYGLNLVGDLDDDKHPKGGKSYGYYTTEARLRVHPKATLNLFYEVGVVNQSGLSELLKSKNKFFHGVGITVCYYSPVLPIQIGCAFPSSRRRNYEGKYIDDAFQFYVGIGQIH